MNFKKNDIQFLFGYSFFSRGEQYFKEGRVTSIEVIKEDEEFIELESRVRGKYSYYTQNIILQKYNNKYILEGRCSCPVGYNCKHVAASLLKLIKLKVKKEDDVDEWLRLIGIANSNELLNQYLDSEYFLVYRLFKNKSHNRCDISIYKCKFLKNGKMSSGTNIKNFDSLLYGYLYNDIIDEDDEYVLELLKGKIAKYDGYCSKVLRGRIGFFILEGLVKTKRAFFKDDNEPLSFMDEEIKLELEWKKSENGYKLSSNLKDFFMIPTEPICVVKKGKIYRLKSDINGDVLENLLNAPSISKKDIVDIYIKLTKFFSIPSIPLPKELELQKIKEQPVPHLTVALEQIYSENLSFIILRFLYGEYAIKPTTGDEIISEFLDNKKVEIVRDLKVEQEAIDRLKGIGFDTFVTQMQEFGFLAKSDDRQQFLSTWDRFLNQELKELKKDGWKIEFQKNFDYVFEDIENISVDSERDDDGWFSLSFDIEFGKKKLSLVPLVSQIFDVFDDIESLPEILNVEVEKNHFLKIPSKQIKPILRTIFELYDRVNGDNSLKIAPYDAHLVFDFDKDIVFKGEKELLELSKKLKTFDGIKRVEKPKMLNATLREYQQSGVDWLNFLHEFKFGGILADDMGLGKTIQTLSFLASLKESGKLDRPSLIVMPTSLLFNWKDEIEKFTPNLSYLTLYGADRSKDFKKIKKYDLILTTYQLVVRDEEKLKKQEFSYVILDEAQKIKNPKTKMANAIKSFKSSYRLAITGTPVENHLGELWSIFSFLMPGFLGSLSFFKKYYQKPIEKDNSISKAELLRKKVAPFILRRTKAEVAKELPPKTEIIKYATFEAPQAKLYESIRITMEKKVKEAIASKGLSRSHITILDALLKLRQVCCDPSLLKVTEAKKVTKSAKMELFLGLVEKLIEEKRKILVFSQFTSMLTIIENELKAKNISFVKLTGATRKREEVIKKFKSDGVDLFLISLKAGGVGLNLVEADSVIHYDPWWNPAVENQATDRAYRIGQDKPVFVYKLIVENTIEQKIIELQKKKEAIGEGVYSTKRDEKEIFKGEELLELLKS
jgi:SNF2 family DNA or RNA helicase